MPDTLFTPEEIREIVTQLCQALWVLHSMAAVHRDSKPDNIILRGSGAVLIDFDAARLHKPEAENDTHVKEAAFCPYCARSVNPRTEMKPPDLSLPPLRPGTGYL